MIYLPMLLRNVDVKTRIEKLGSRENEIENDSEGERESLQETADQQVRSSVGSLIVVAQVHSRGYW